MVDDSAHHNLHPVIMFSANAGHPSSKVVEVKVVDGHGAHLSGRIVVF